MLQLHNVGDLRVQINKFTYFQQEFTINQEKCKVAWQGRQVIQ